MFTRAHAERSIEWLLASPQKLGDAKRDMVFAEQMVKRVKSLVMKKHADKPLTAQEREAYASDEWQKAVREAADAAAYYELLRAEKDAHAALMEGWRTVESSARQMVKL